MNTLDWIIVWVVGSIISEIAFYLIGLRVWPEKPKKDNPSVPYLPTIYKLPPR